ncbi:3-oxo-5-alpha-steroid 4-dehydrogenase-domain-containing protein [Gigaspora margarita]|uniref:3-oxo-5-alpha-steroid 4-dehydrogenase-domain-containing protein n=1 Tax=Gigaspora margarita TaxID=4874 RepID=A0A8H4AIC3_GIGMA|nr:3-oxo-5-alpha-steroid 4-dehydrogenase-domain-containing protein [Gigaspora margarita]
MPTLLFLIRLFYIIIIASAIIIASFRSLKISILSYGKFGTSARFTAKNPIEAYIQSLTVPKQWFKHYYVVGTLWVTFLIIDVIILRKGNKGHFAWFVQIFDNIEKYEPEYFKEPVTECIIGLVMLQVQTIRRMYECFFIERPSVGAKMHVGLYILGLAFYLATGLSVFIEGIGNFGILDSKDNEPNLFTIHSTNFLSWNILLAISVFIYASHHQYILHKNLALLRLKSSSVSSQPLYSIPKGDWFDHISSAHYTAEIIIYFSFVILTKGFNLTIWLTFIWTIVCLGIIAKNSEKWGREKFGEEWPKNRWIIMPGIY